MIKEKLGSYFKVTIFDTHVEKEPRNNVPEVFISLERLKEIARLQNQLSEVLPEVLPCRCENGKLIIPKAPGEWCGPYERMPEEAWWLYVLPKINRFLKNVELLGYIFTHPKDERKQPNVSYDEDNEQVYWLDFHDIKYGGLSMDAEVVQIKNPKTGKYTKIDKTSGKILAHKKSDGPYKNIPIIPLVETEERAEVPEIPRGVHDVPPDPTRTFFGKKIRPVKTIK